MEMSPLRLLVVYRTIPTSNHNCEIVCVLDSELYIVLFLHQTTTSASAHRIVRCCISYYSYIKPQLMALLGFFFCVVYRTIPTSNHNPRSVDRKSGVVVYRTIPTSNHNPLLTIRCFV